MADQRLDRLESEMGSLKADQERGFKEVMESMQLITAKIMVNLPTVNRHQCIQGRHIQDHFKMVVYFKMVPRMVKMDFPKFNGEEDPISWVCRADQFFEFYQTPKKDRIPLEELGIATWEDFKSSHHVRYGPTQFQDFFGNLTKLQQTGLVRDYQTQFERLLIHVGRLMPV
ncbi:hypothetical protein AMTRI_Chr03g46780 [Amborella trichopoda]